MCQLKIELEKKEDYEARRIARKGTTQKCISKRTGSGTHMGKIETKEERTMRSFTLSFTPHTGI